MMRFPKDVREKLKHYVYRLVDPRDGTTFYVGRGQGNRIFKQHAGRVIEPGSEAGRMEARRKLQAIQRAGLKPLRVVHRSGMEKSEAAHVEAALIAAYPGATNHMPKDGPLNACQLARQLGVDANT